MLTRSDSNFFELLYISSASGAMTIKEVEGIATQASARNKNTGVTGMLIFDGDRFCQHLEGDEKVLRIMYSSLLRDPRHYDLRLLYSGFNGKRRFHQFGMGFANIGDVGILRELVVLEGERAMQAFVGIVPLRAF